MIMKFDYIAQDKNGKRYRGALEAGDEAAARAKLVQLDLKVVELKVQAAGARLEKVKAEEVIIFTERLSIMINAGLPIIRCLKTISRQSESETLKNVIHAVCLDLEGGSNLSGALARHPAVFSGLFINLVKAGETGGILSKVLIRISEYLNKERALRQNLVKAFSYPVIVGLVAILVVTFLVVFIVPVFAQTYDHMGLKLPLPTLTLIFLSVVARRYWWLVLTLVIAGIAGYKAFSAQKSGRLMLDRFKINLPVFGRLNRDVAVARFIRTFGLLLSSGIPVVQALAVVKEASGSGVVTAAIERVKKEITQGVKIADVLAKEEIFSPMVVQMVASGEASSSLSEMLEKTADFLDRDVDDLVQKLVVRLEPLLTFMLALVVGFIALAIYLPMFDLIAKVGKG